MKELGDFDSFAIFRYPDTGQIRIIKGHYHSGLHIGFAIAPFLNPGNNLGTITSCQESTWETISIVLDSLMYQNTGLTDSGYSNANSILINSTDRLEHQRAVETIINELGSNEDKKTITCRIISGNQKIDFKKTFLNLADKLPNAFIFLFYTPQSGCWLGASPEILLTSENNTFTTYALAGTRKCGESEPWDPKNIKEHRIVFDYIIDQFKNAGLKPFFSPLSTRIAGNIEHLFQEIYSEYTTNNLPQFPLTEFLNNFSPTPALCGMPKGESLDRIKRVESFDREYYGGFCGWHSGIREFKFYVMLRCMKVNRNGWYYFSGGGITCHSDVKTEWFETEIKSRTILDNLIFKD